MKHIKWQVFFVAILFVISAFFYYLNYLAIHDARHIIDYFLIDMGFVPFEVFLVTLIFERLLHIQERRRVSKKMHMVAGAFYSEVGMRLLKQFIFFFGLTEELKHGLLVNSRWVVKDYLRAIKQVRGDDFSIDAKKGNLEDMRKFLSEERGFLLGLLENPNVLEHESFAELLWAVFHLTEELCARVSLKNLPEPDYEHLGNDIKRAYRQLLMGWLVHLQHLSKDYPYLFSLAVRTNPFDDTASAVIIK